MPTERLSMRHIREVLRLHHSVGMSQRAVARSLNLAQGTVSKYLNRTRRAGLSWPLPPELDNDVRLENRLYPPPSDLPSEAAAGLGDGASRAAPAGRDADAVVGGVLRHDVGRLQLFVVLRALQGMGRTPEAAEVNSCCCFAGGTALSASCSLRFLTM